MWRCAPPGGFFFKLLFFMGLFCGLKTQNRSPCPRLFTYEPRNNEEDRWYGVVSLQTPEDLDGVWLKIILDKPAELLGNWFGESSSTDNTEFTIKNPRYKLEAGPPVSVRFFVKYNTYQDPPSVRVIRLNGKTICSDRVDGTTSTTPGLFISNLRPTTSRPSFTQNRNPDFESTSSDKDTNNNNNNNNNNGYGESEEQERPSRTTQRPIRGGSSNSQHGTSASSSSSGQKHHQNQGQNTETQTLSNNNRNPSGSMASSNQPNRRPASTGTSLSAEDSVTVHGSDVFLGDFVPNGRPQQSQTQKPQIFKREISCGTVTTRASPLISYGQGTKQGQWPWHAALFVTQNGQFMYTCGGTLVSDSHVVTAAHCVTRPSTNRAVALEKLAIYLGKYSLKKFDSPVQSRELDEIIVHPRYNSSFFHNDIAILKLDKPVDFDSYVRPCCLWEDSREGQNIENRLGTVVGWGFDENRQISDTLMQAQMPVVSATTCIFSNREFFSQFMNEQTYCAGFRNGTSDQPSTTVCNGDSGGGMVFQKPGSSRDNPVWQIRGIVSVGVALQGQGVCDPTHYIVFTDVAKHTAWIRKVIHDNP